MSVRLRFTGNRVTFCDTRRMTSTEQTAAANRRVVELEGEYIRALGRGEPVTCAAGRKLQAAKERAARLEFIYVDSAMPAFVTRGMLRELNRRNAELWEPVKAPEQNVPACAAFNLNRATATQPATLETINKANAIFWEQGTA